MNDTTTPKQVILRGSRYNVTVHEGALIFSSSDPCGPCYTRIMLERCCGCWHVSLESFGTVSLTHIEEAGRLAREWFGDNHEFQHGENEL